MRCWGQPGGETDTSLPRKVTLGRDAKGEAITVTQGALWTVPAARMKGKREASRPAVGAGFGCVAAGFAAASLG
jgi:hypothetical protein